MPRRETWIDGGVGDVRTMTTEEYLAAPLLRRFAYKVLPKSFHFLRSRIGAAVFMFQSIFSQRRAGQIERRSVLRTNMALLFVVGLATWTIGFRTYLQIQLPIILIAGSLGLWLFYIQHQFESAYWARHGSWDPMK